jgi:hypothetical protein
VADGYSHRPSAMAIAQRVYGKKDVAECSVVVSTNVGSGYLFRTLER